MKFGGKGCVIVILVLFFSITFVPYVLAFETLDKTIYVDDDNSEGPWDGTQEHPFQHIQDAIDAAEEGYTVFVFSGLYCENIILDKTLILQGEEKTSTIINGGA